METLVTWFTTTLAPLISKEAVIFIISMMPILELRGGLLAASPLFLDIPMATAIPICIIGNILPIPFILLFIKKIFAALRNVAVIGPLVKKLEDRAMKKSDSVKKGEFIGLLLFVGIPLPGTGAWTGSLIAALLEMDIKKASIAILLGILLATVIMTGISYGLLGTVANMVS